MKKTVSILVMTITDAATESVVNAFGDLHITFLKSKPSYTNYLKTLQYLPDAIIIEMPNTFHDQLHFVQMVKQNSLANEIPIICFGDKIDSNIAQGMKKIGIDEYITLPFDMKQLADTVIKRLQKKGVVLRVRSRDSAQEKKTDIDRILSMHTPRHEKIELMMKHISDIMAFPFTVSMALKLLASEKSAANDLAKIIETDPTISANFLKKANSVYLAGKNTRTVTMKDAIVRIGFTETRRIITGMAVMQLFDASRYNPGFNRVEFWYHCLATAKIAELLAGMSQTVSPDEAFLAGIMHDFGIILLDEFFPELFARILQISTDLGKRFFETEEDILSITHNDIVRVLFTQWKIPESITFAVLNHYKILQSNMESPSGKETMAVVVSIANILAKTFRLGSSCDQFVFPIEKRYFSILRSTFGFPDNFYQQIISQLDMYKELLKIEGEPAENLLKTPAIFSSRLTIGIADFSSAVFNPIESYLRLCKQSIVPVMVPSYNYDAYRYKCDLFLVFTDSSTSAENILPLTRIEKRYEGSNPSDKTGNAPVIVFINKENLCTAAVNIPGVSLLPCALDLRMLEVYIDSVVRGKTVKNLPWESVIRPSSTARAVKIDKRAERMNEAYRTLRHFKDQCAQLRIFSEEQKVAESYFQQAKIHETKNDFDRAYMFLALAAEYYRKSYLSHEISECVKKITDGEANLNKTV